MGCNCNQPTPCNQPPALCECPTILKSDCVVFSGNDLPCSGITTGQTLTETVEQLDIFICEKVNDITNALTLKNIGTGSEVYKGVDLLGRKEIRKINAVGSLATVTQNTNDISVSINETNLDTFIENNQKTYTVANVGTGVQAYKNSTIVGNNTQYNFRTVVKQDLGDGVSFLRDIQQNTNELNVRVKTLVSDNLTITSTDDEVRIETPMTASIPALYVNNLYVPSYPEWLAENKIQNGGTAITGFVFRGKGTLAQPFTESTVYPLAGGSATITPNTAIQNALDGDSAYALPYSYVGSTALSYSRLNPQRIGQQMVVQDNNGSYNFAGNFNYTNLDLKLEGSILSTTSGFLIDMEDSSGFDQATSKTTITIDENRILQLQGQGLKNNGSTVATNTLSPAKIVNLFGEGYIFTTTNDITKYIINSDTTSTGNNNDGNLTFDVKCNLRAVYQGIYFVGGNSRIDFYKTVQSGDLGVAVNVSLKAFNQTGGQVRFFNQSEIIYEGLNRTNVFTFEPSTFNTTFLGLGNYFKGATATNMFNKLNSNNVGFSVTNTQALHNITNIFESPDIWLTNFRDNSFNTGLIDPTKVDLTQGNNISAINTLGNNVIETLVVYSSKASAKVAGLSTNSAFIKRKVFSAGTFIAGLEYKVITSGSPSLGAVGSFFTATGLETGTGTASLETREILT